MQRLYLRDIIKRYNLPEKTLIGEVLDVITSGISSLTNPKKIADTLASVKQEKISNFTVNKYIEHMEDAFMLSRVKRYNIKGRKYIGTPYKIYFEDIGLRHIRFHDLRHSCATLLLHQGFSMKKIQQWLGHSTYQLTADTYSHVSAEDKTAMAEVLNEIICL